jgi:ribonuclease HII
LIRAGKCGADEAGRGPVLGPLVVAAVMVEDDGPLVEMGVRDSKLLKRSRRAELYPLIEEVSEIKVMVISHDQIDDQRRNESLNEIEARAFASAISRFAGNLIYLDAADVNPRRFGSMVSRYLGLSVEMVCEHRADELYPVVSAASIIAKETRDRLMDRIGEEMGREVGSGYSHDPKTRAFLENWICENGDLPPCARRSWETSRRLLALSRTKRLTD